MERTKPLTVAIPTYNGARHLADALRSILAQGRDDFDLLICDDRSKDGTAEIVRAEVGDRARMVVNGERLGLAGNWNRCVEMSEADWVAVFHQDDVMRPGHLESHLRAIAEDNGDRLGLVAGRAEAINDLGDSISGSLIEPGDIGTDAMPPACGQTVRFRPGEFLPQLAVRNPLRCSAVTTRKAAWADVGGFDPSLRYVVDWDFWIRVARHWSVAWIPSGPTVDFRWHPASETQRFKTGTADLDEQIELLTKLYATDGASWPHARRWRREADRRLARAYLNRAYDAAKTGDGVLTRRSFGRAVAQWPGILGDVAVDPRLAARLAGTALTPGRGRKGEDGAEAG